MPNCMKYGPTSLLCVHLPSSDSDEYVWENFGSNVRTSVTNILQMDMFKAYILATCERENVETQGPGQSTIQGFVFRKLKDLC